MQAIFRNRVNAGRQLAECLAKTFAGKGNQQPPAIVLALPRGGVPVAYEIARRFGLPLDLLMVRKVGMPGNSEFAMGAVASGGVEVVDTELLKRWSISQKQFDAVAGRERQEIERREQIYRGDRPSLRVAGKTVILVDDGIATGASTKAAIEALKQLAPSRIILAVPVAAQASAAVLKALVDELVVVSSPPDFHAVGAFYEDFSQTSDEEVCRLMQNANA